MLTILDYIEKNQKTFEEEPLNEIDILILSEFTMLNFKKAIKPITISKKLAFQEYLDIIISASNLNKPTYIKDLYRQELFSLLVDSHQDEKNLQLLHLLCASRRFRMVALKYHVDEFDVSKEKQFSATTFIYQKAFAVIAFRGTDATFVGWKEDFNMAYICPIASHIEARQYLDAIAGYLPKNLYVAGHSKGGNLAVYAAIHCKKAIRDKITRVYSFDGPGFTSEVLKLPAYQQIQTKMLKIVPQGSIIGLLLETLEPIKVVTSNGFWINQHDPYSWELTDSWDFKYLDDVDINAKRTKISIDDWYTSFDDEGKKLFINEVYRILIATGANNFAELNSNISKYLPKIISFVTNMDKDKRKLVIDSFVNLGKSHMKNLTLKIK